MTFQKLTVKCIVEVSAWSYKPENHALNSPVCLQRLLFGPEHTSLYIFRYLESFFGMRKWDWLCNSL